MILKWKKISKIGAIVALLNSTILLFSSCIATRELRATILDKEGNPVPNSIFYAESYTHKDGILDFVHSKAGSKGEVPPESNRPLVIRWKPNAQIAIAIFAPGKSTVVVFDRTNYYKTHDMIFNLQTATGDQPQWKPAISHLAFPFENNAELRTRVTLEENASLVRTFLHIYMPVISGEEPAVQRERQKAEAVERLSKELTISVDINEK